jgi:hypothetical protein
VSFQNVNEESKAKQDITWEKLIEHCKAEIKSCQEKVKILNKSLFFFEKQALSGVKFPRKKTGRH